MSTLNTVLDEEVVPERELVVHRRDELEELLSALRPTEVGPSDLVYLLGDTGTGKTMLARMAFDLLTQELECQHTYIDCWRHYERRDILYEIVSGFQELPVNRKAVGRGELLDRLDTTPDYPRYVVLDEADQLADPAVLYDLYETPNLSLVLVANDDDAILEGIADRLQSRLTVGRRILCRQYTTDQLAEILDKRMAYLYGSPGTTYTMRQLEDVAAAAEGDARRAIRILREAVTIYRDSDAESITNEHVSAALPIAREELRQKDLEKLNEHQQRVFEIIRDYGPLSPGAINERYEAAVEEPRSERTVRNYLKKMRQYNLIECEGTAKDRRYSVVM